MHYNHSCRQDQSHPPRSIAWLHGVQLFLPVTAYVHRSYRHHPLYHLSDALSWAQLRLRNATLALSYNIFSMCCLFSLFLPHPFVPRSKLL